MPLSSICILLCQAVVIVTSALIAHSGHTYTSYTVQACTKPLCVATCTHFTALSAMLNIATCVMCHMYDCYCNMTVTVMTVTSGDAPRGPPPRGPPPRGPPPGTLHACILEYIL
jgi:hypothetical protein